jgi:hypothetical protein
MSSQMELNQSPEELSPLLSGQVTTSNPILTYMAALFEESFLGKMSTYGFLSSTGWWPSD